MLRQFCFLSMLIAFSHASFAQTADSSYAEKLGYPRGARVLILHVDDVGMSFDSNEGAIQSLTKGVANSCSIMMPCSWVPGFVHYLKQHPELDAGLHLTLTSEWKEYRWGPLMGKTSVPGLVDGEGALWASVEEVVNHAKPEEVEMEIRAQIERARDMGFEPTHLDSHMGTLFASPAFIEKYLKVGIEYNIPVMFPGGHATLIQTQMKMPDMQIQFLRGLAKQLWTGGLPVIDDLHNSSYDWELPKGKALTDENLRKLKTTKYIEGLKSLKPGVTMMIMHCTSTSELFQHISDSGPTRKGDMLAMMDPEFRKALASEKIILTTWRELKKRRDAIR